VFGTNAGRSFRKYRTPIGLPSKITSPHSPAPHRRYAERCSNVSTPPQDTDCYLECGDLHHGFARVKCGIATTNIFWPSPVSAVISVPPVIRTGCWNSGNVLAPGCLGSFPAGMSIPGSRIFYAGTSSIFFRYLPFCAPRSCKGDEGRPLGVGLQGQTPNHPKLRWLRAIVVSVLGKVTAEDCGRWCSERRTQVNH
jgi:hypothetical protein